MREKQRNIKVVRMSGHWSSENEWSGKVGPEEDVLSRSESEERTSRYRSD